MEKSDNLKALADGLKELARAIDQIAQGIGGQTASAPAPKKTVAKKKPAKAKPKKSTKAPTKLDVVFATIRRARKGLDTAELMKRTGFDKRTISNSVYKLKKSNKIKSPKKGIYIKI